MELIGNIKTIMQKWFSLKSELADVAISGDYDDLEDKPTLFSGDYDDLTNKPDLFSGSYTDLTDKPTLFSGSYTDLTDKPDTFTPSSHTHGNLQNDGQVGSTAQANKNVVTDSNGKITTEAKYSHPSYTSQSNGLYKITVDNTGHVSATSAVSGSDLPSHTHSYLASSDVVNNLTSTSTTAPLSAYQGKLLNEKIGSELAFWNGTGGS